MTPALEKHFQQIKDKNLTDLFADDPDRTTKFSLKIGDIYLDFSKNRITEETLQLLFDLAQAKNLTESIQDMFEGKKINTSEDRPVLHIALRNRSNTPILIDGQDVMPKVNAVLVKMRATAQKIRSGNWLGFTGQPVKNIINIGIGGSDLGPVMAYEALKFYSDRNLNLRFISNIDPAHFFEATRDLNPEETLFIIASKSFTTQEPITNAQTAKVWLLEALKNDSAVANHFIALSTNLAAIQEFGINPDNMFEFWDWVGGRYSLCSAIGLSLMVAIGPDNFDRMLDGFHLIDNHFKTAPLEKNLPVILGLLGVWYNNFFNFQTHALLPYSQYLNRFPAYFQQGSMESNGKSVTKDGQTVNYQTGEIIWGEPGSVSQHSFFQLLHQGTKVVPADFIGFIKPLTDFSDQHQKLMANFFAQTKALAFGKIDDPPYKFIPGNRPTNSILVEKLTPHTLGQLIALYEHKIFTQGIIWGIDSFDQWGVELGKILAKDILAELKSNNLSNFHDSSTNSLLKHYQELS